MSMNILQQDVGAGWITAQKKLKESVIDNITDEPVFDGKG